MKSRPIIVELKQVQQEAKDIHFLTFNRPTIMEYPLPGQFLMVWVIDSDEIPISISRTDKVNNTLSLAVKMVGITTGELIKLGEGDTIGVRGPLGRSFSLIGKKPLIIGGGIGTAPLIPLTQQMQEEGIEFTFINGARTKEELIFHDYLQEQAVEYYVTTDDGSLGVKGFTTELAKELLNKQKFDQIYTCGPELMMKEVLALGNSKGIPIQASLERIFKCGVGLCGHCVLDPPGLLACKDGPIFSSEQLLKCADFGSFKRDFNGKKIPI